MWGNQGGFDQGGGGGGGGGFGGGGGDQGGGYMNTSTNFGSSQGEQSRPRQRAQNVLPCTVAQVLAAEQQDDRFLVGSSELHQVSIVGVIRSVKDAPTRLDYELDDMTGPFLEVRQFVDNDENTPDEERTTPMRENTYVKVFGHVRAFGGKRNVVAFKVMPITDMNALTTHMLEVIHSHLYLSKGMGGPGKVADSSGMANNSINAGGGQQSFQMQADPGLSPMQAQVQAVIRACPDDQGASIQLISSKLRGMPEKSIRDALEFLSTEGHVYSTIDDDHFKSTDSM